MRDGRQHRASQRAVAAEPQLDLDLPRRAQRRLTDTTPVGQRHRIAGLFLGIGGIELGMERAGHHAVSAALLRRSGGYGFRLRVSEGNSPKQSL